MHLSEGQVRAVTPASAAAVAGRYRIDGPIGSGGMGTVYRADDTLLHRRVAIKVLNAPYEARSVRARLLAEARAASALNHPNICTTFEVGDEDGLPFIVMEYVDGQPLSSLIPPGYGLPVESALAYGVQIADALAHAHERGIIHRDLKCANVIINPEDRAKVLDFGLAMRAGGDVHAETSTAWNTSEPGDRTAGTLAYMSPEVLRGGAADPRADIWALGVVLYEMAAGERPFVGNTAYDLAAAILTEPMRPLPTRVPVALSGVIGRCLSKNPETRYQSPAEVRAALEALQTGKRDARGLRHWAGGIGLALLLTAIVATALVIESLVRMSPQAGPVKLAVIPLVPEGTTFELASITENIAETIINDIAPIDPSSLQVISLSTALQYKNARGDLVDVVHQELGATFVASIKVTREGDSFIISAGLDDARNRSRKWGDLFAKQLGGDISTFALEADIATHIAENIGMWLTNKPLAHADRQLFSQGPTLNDDAWLLYSEGRHYWYTPTSTGDTYLKSLDLYQRALQKDGKFALAYIGIADTYLSMAWEGWIPTKDGRDKAKEAMEKANAIDPKLGELHYTRASLLWWERTDWPVPESEYVQAIRKVPSSAAYRRFYANGLAMLGQFDKAIIELQKALELDPKGLGTNMALGTTYYWARRTDDAIKRLQLACTLDITSAAPHEELADIYDTKGWHDQAITERQEALRLVGDVSGAETLALEYERDGYTAATQRLYERQLRTILAQKALDTYVSPVAFALLYIKLGRPDEAFEWLEHAVEEESAWLFYLNVDPAFDPIRGDPRFNGIVRRVKIPAAERGSA